MSLPGLSFKFLSVKIASGQSLSNALAVLNLHIVAIVMPAAWDTAVLTFQASWDGNTFLSVYDINGSEVTVQAAANRHIILPPLSVPTARQVILRSGTTASPVNQTAAANLILVCREYA